jgi:type VI secretion system VasD/TssJ family lipoprotein
MKACLGIALIIVGLTFLGSCGISHERSLEYDGAFDELTIHLSSTRGMNTIEGTPHSLLLCVYQLENFKVFEKLTGRYKDIYRLLECSPFDPSVTDSRCVVLLPGQNQVLQFHLAEKTRYIGLVAGYYHLQRENAVRLFRVPFADSGTDRRRTRIDLTLGPGGFLAQDPP